MIKYDDELTKHSNRNSMSSVLHSLGKVLDDGVKAFAVAFPFL